MVNVPLVGTLDDVCVDERIRELIAEKGQFENEDRIGKGIWGEVFRLSDDYVVKILYDVGDLSEEYCLNKLFYDGGISVPKPYGLFDVGNRGTSKTGFVMEYIHGIGTYNNFKEFYNSLHDKFGRINEESLRLDEKFLLELIKCKESGEEHLRLVEKLQLEVAKCKVLGYIARDTRLFHNSIYVPDTDKIVLIDFDPEYWEKAEKEND